MRIGVGTKLCRWVMEQAAQERVPVTLEASVLGRQLYSKLGFVQFDRSVINENLQGNAMMWEPPAQKGSWLQVLVQPESNERGLAALKPSIGRP
jgi:hypothetical protein